MNDLCMHSKSNKTSMCLRPSPMNTLHVRVHFYGKVMFLITTSDVVEATLNMYERYSSVKVRDAFVKPSMHWLRT